MTISGESAESNRERQSAREVAMWEAAFAAATDRGSAPPADDADQANAGAMVSRAHRAEKASARTSHPAGPGTNDSAEGHSG